MVVVLMAAMCAAGSRAANWARVMVFALLLPPLAPGALVADRFSGYERACVATEPAMVEDKGDFVWRGITR